MDTMCPYRHTDRESSPVSVPAGRSCSMPTTTTTPTRMEKILEMERSYSMQAQASCSGEKRTNRKEQKYTTCQYDEKCRDHPDRGGNCPYMHRCLYNLEAEKKYIREPAEKSKSWNLLAFLK